jgi:hypothetical protein
MAKPTLHLTHPDFKYRNSAQTDVTTTWRRFGWQPINGGAHMEPEPTPITDASKSVKKLLGAKAK